MKNHIAFKFIAILLCALTLTASVVCAVGIYALSANGLYDKTWEENMKERRDQACQGMAYYLVGSYAAENLSNCSPEALEAADFYDSLNGEFYNQEAYLLTDGEWFYTIEDPEGNILEQSENIPAGTEAVSFSITYFYPVLVGTTAWDLDSGEEIMPGDTVSRDTTITTDSGILFTTTEPDASQYDDIRSWESMDGIVYNFFLRYEPTPQYTVTLYLTDSALSYYDSDLLPLLDLLQEHRYNLMIFLAVSLLLFAIGAVYLCCAAGRQPGSDAVMPGGLNRLPLDVYALGLALACALFVYLGDESGLFGDSIIYLGFLGVLVFLGCLLLVAFCFACAAQFKAGGGYWWRNSFIGWACVTCWKGLKLLLQGLGRIFRWLGANVPPFLGKAAGRICGFFRKLWAILKSVCMELWTLLCRGAKALWALIRSGFRRLGSSLARFYSLLPLTWQWLLTGFAMTVVLCIAIWSDSGGWLLVGFAVFFGIILYGAHAFGILLEGVKHMSGGDLDTKVSDQFLVGGFKEFAGDLNALADVAVVAAQKQMKSERMKTELITNVSHDIKTPLTSIINYVDLLEKPHTPEEERQYLEVLGRQSQRMKKLIEDLVEMSKASTGNLAADIREVDAAEAINQALGEYADKLAQMDLTPVFNQPAEPILMKADGRLAWRVLSNLLSNAVKYALPGTRLYVDLVRLDGKVLISLKNISREQLNVAADELMERFVRGDASRNTEGSGLGLNIAKSLMEVQHGQLQLLVDGDLFKATVVFPAV